MSKLMRDNSRSRTWIMVGVMSVTGVLLSSCSSHSVSLTAGAGTCFQVLPVAQRAIAAGKQYMGVRVIDAKTTTRMFGKEISSRQSYFCLVAYRLQPSQSQSSSLPANRFAMVVVSPNTKQVIGIRQVARLPFSFRRNLSVG